MIHHNWDNPTSAERLQMVFVNRNQNYGAYTIRKSYDRNLFNVFVTTCSIGIILSFSPQIYHRFFPVNMNHTIDTKTVVIEINKLDLKKLEMPKEVIKKIEASSKPSGSKNSYTIPTVVDSTIDEIPTKDPLANDKSGLKTEIDSTEEIEEKSDNRTGLNKFETVLHSEEMPVFVGGEEAMLAYITKNLHYPEDAKNDKIDGIVYISFIVDVNGNLQNIKTKRGIGGGCEEEAIRVLSNMPKWKPGKDNGRPVNVEFILPFKFTLY